MFNNLDVGTDTKTGYNRSDFLRADADRKKALAGVDVEVAEQAVTDSERASQRAAGVMARQGSGAPVGGGTFNRLRGRRGGLVLGGAMTGGLAAANRAKLADAKRSAIATSFKADTHAMASTGGGGITLRALRKKRLI